MGESRRGLVIFLVIFLMVFFCNTMVVFGAQDIEDITVDEANEYIQNNITDGNTTEDEYYDSGETSQQEGTEAPDYGQGSVSDYLKDYTPVTQGQMQKASKMASPIVNFIGVAVGILVCLLFAWNVLQTGIDLVYISAPALRSILNPDSNVPTPGVMGGGVGMGGYGGHGYGMGGMMGANMQSQAQKQDVGLRRQWVSDEAVGALSEAQPVQATTMGGNQFAGGMGMAGMQQQQAANINKRSVIATYFKRRVVYTVIFALCTIILLSSILTDCGINLAMLGIKLIAKLNRGIAGAM